MYALGIDLGTTYTAAATWRDGRAQIVALGGRGAAIPSVVLLRSDETFLTGEAANRRGLTEPQRVAREFKRRIGDTTPLMLGGTPYSAEALMSQLLRAVVSEVTTREGGPPASVCVSHPANWGPYKIDLLRQAVRMADLPSVSFVTEPEAAAVNYASEQRLGVGAAVAVYDLGGGTFDAAVLRRTVEGFTILGQPEGIERLGGIDFDAAVFNHVRTTLGTKLDDLDDDDPAVISAVARLREECVQAKEALSADTDTAIPVLLPSVTTEVRLTRGELESMIRPALHGSIEALQRAVRSAGLTPEQLHSVLLVGGSSRMPLVGQLVTAELGRPVAVDTHPKHAVALGAARLAGGGFAAPTAPKQGGVGTVGRGAAAGLGAAGLGMAAGGGAPAGAVGGGMTSPRAGGGSAGLGGSTGAGAAGSASGLAGGAGGPGGGGAGPLSGQGARPGGHGAAGGGIGGGAAQAGGHGGGVAGSGLGGAAGSGAGGAGPQGAKPGGWAGEPGGNMTAPRAGGAGAAGDAVFGHGSAGHRGAGGPGTPPGGIPTGVNGGPGRGPSGGRGGPEAARGPGAGGPRAERTGTTHRLEVGSESGRSGPLRGAERSPVGPPPAADGRRRRVLVLAAGVVVLVLLAGVGVGLVVFGGDDNKDRGAGASQPTTTASSVPVDERCTDAIMSNPRWVCLTSAIVADGKITIDYRGDGAPLNINGGYHLHVYGGDGTSPAANVMGMQAPASEQGKWYVEDRHPAVLAVTDERFVSAIGDAPKVCARIADANHNLVPDSDGAFATGNCVSITRTETSTTTTPPPQTHKPPTRKSTTATTTTTTDSSTTTTTTTTDPSLVAPTGRSAP